MRLVRRIYQYLVLLIIVSSSVSFADDHESVVDELAWGEALFFHFQDNKIEALTRLSARLEQGRLDKNRSQAELLLAGILLDYGLPTQAEDLLQNLGSLKDSPDKAARMYLANARVYYQQQQYQQAQASLELVDFEQLTRREKTQASFMLAQIQFGLGDFTSSAQTLAQVEDSGNLQLYAKYNLGISLLNVDNSQSQTQAIATLSQVANSEIIDQEQYALADQAKLALGLHALNQSRYEDADQILKSVRLDGLVSDDALLLLGWNAMNQQAYDQALGYWVSLAGKEDILSPVVQEAWLAVPYVWQMKGDKTKARSGYETAIRIQARAQQRLDQLKQGSMWRDILMDNKSKAIIQSQALYQQLIANPAFYELKDQWQELHELDNLLTEQARVVPVMALSVKEQRDRFFNKSAEAKTLIADIDIQQVEQQIFSYQQALEQQLSMPISPGLMSEKESSIWTRLERSKETLSLVEQTDEMTDKKEQVRRLNGVFYWQYHRDLNQKQWQATQSQQQLEREYQALKKQHNSLVQIIEQAQPPIEIDANKLTSLTTRIDNLKNQISLVKTALEQDMANVYQDFLMQRQYALDNLAEQANLSLARLSFEAATQGLEND